MDKTRGKVLPRSSHGSFVAFYVFGVEGIPIRQRLNHHTPIIGSRKVHCLLHTLCRLIDAQQRRKADQITSNIMPTPPLIRPSQRIVNEKFIPIKTFSFFGAYLILATAKLIADSTLCVASITTPNVPPPPPLSAQNKSWF